MLTNPAFSKVWKLIWKKQLGWLALAAGGIPTAHGADPAIHDRNWPTWRGPSNNGVVLHGNPPVEWSEEKNVKWKVEIPGNGHATPVIWEKQIFVLAAVPTGKRAEIQDLRTSPNVVGQVQETPPPPRRGEGPGGRRPGGGGQAPTEEFAFTTLCLDRETGKVLWQKVSRQEIPHQGKQPSNSFCSGSPVTDGERVYSYFGSSGLYCYDLKGNLIWDKDLGRVSVTFGEGSSPALFGDALFIVQDNNRESYLYAFDKKTGAERWKKRRVESSGWTTPLVFKHGARTQVILSGGLSRDSGAVRSYDAETGEVLWECSGLGSNPVPMIVTDGTMVFAMSGHNNPAALAIKLGRSGDLSGTDAVRWTTKLGVPYVPSPILSDGLLFFCQRTEARLSCLDAATGEPHYAQVKVEGVSGVYASPIAVQNRIYIPGQNGVTIVVEKSKSLNVLATNKLDDGFDASPAVVGNELFLRGRSHLYCLATK